MREKLWNSVVFEKKYPSAWFQRKMLENHAEFESVDRPSMDITTFNQVEQFWIFIVKGRFTDTIKVIVTRINCWFREYGLMKNAKKTLNTWRVSHLKFSHYGIVFNLVGLQISVELLYRNTNTQSWSWYACITGFAFKKFSVKIFLTSVHLQRFEDHLLLL